jgi:cell fate regulator YaaT (PSP1 superfamily)
LDIDELLEMEAYWFCPERIRERNLPMKLIDVECLFDKSQIVFYFTA